MKKFLYTTLVLFAALCLAPSCNRVDIPSVIEGEWHHSSEGCDIYISFNSTGTFQLFQKLGEGRYYRYGGSWGLNDDDILSGTYDDGTPWGSSYEVSFGEPKSNPGTMTLSATNGSGESNTYTRTPIPEEVREESVDAFYCPAHPSLPAPDRAL